MSDVFISYARSTEAEAGRIGEALRALGYGVWRDDELPAHRDYSEVIEERLRAAKAVVVVWSAEAVKSQWVRAEADFAREAGKLVQLTLDGAALPMPFNRIQSADLNGWSGDLDAPSWLKVVTSVNDLCGAAPADAAPPRASRPTAAPAGPLLAVLAFDNLSGDAEMAYFSDGVSDEILQTVASGSELRVIGRGSSFQFRGAAKAAGHVAAVLNATHVLDGSVRRSGSRVRISASLVECAHETTLWSDRFDRELSDVFALQDEIAAAVAAALKVAFAPAVEAETVNPAAYNLYLKALDIRNRGLESDSRLAVSKLLAEATNLAPRFARAWAFLATIQAERLRFDEDDRPYRIARAEVETTAGIALSLDPGLGTAYQALSRLPPAAAFADREALHQTALSVAPNDPTVLTNASLFFTELGRVHEALGYARRAYSLDPMYPWVANWYANMVAYAGHPEDASALFEQLRARWPDNILIAWNCIASGMAHGDWAWVDVLLAAVEARGLDSPTLRLVIDWSRAVRDPSPEVQARVLNQYRETLESTGGLSLSNLGLLYKLGLSDEVFELVDQSTFAYAFDPQLRSPDARGSNGVIFSNPRNAALMRDPRFPRLCAKLGLCDYWVESGRWPDCAEVVAPVYDFKAECRRLATSGGGRLQASGGR
ncbi:MAG TPA: TIR domain-containing protein [Caulobacteraceae bacterium]|nr:TIR domain-containing protein [Caulobacteraceae bacterium]